MLAETQRIIADYSDNPDLLERASHRTGGLGQAFTTLKVPQRRPQGGGEQVERLADHSAPPIEERRAVMAELERIERELNGMERGLDQREDWL